MAPAPRTRRRPGSDVCDPGVVTAAEWDTAMGFAAADAVVFAADWARLPARERERVAALEDAYDSDGHYLAPDYTPDLPTASDTDAAAAAATGDDPDADAEYARVEARRADGFGVQESGWLALAAAGAEQVSTRELLAIAEATAGSLGIADQRGAPGDSITQLRCIDRLTASLAARRHAVLASLCPAQDPGGFRAEQHLLEEIQVAARVGPGIAHRDITAARLLAGPLARSHADLAAGLISDAHIRVLIFETRNIVDDPTPHPDLTSPGLPGPDAAPLGPGRTREGKLTAIQDRVAAAAHRQTPSQFRVSVRAAICAVDATGDADRRAAAKTTRDVSVGQDSDGMGVLVDRDDTASITAIHTELTRQAKTLQTERGGTRAARTGHLDARIGACRADVLKTLILGARNPHPTTTDTVASTGGARGCGGEGAPDTGSAGAADTGSADACDADHASSDTTDPATDTGAGSANEAGTGPGRSLEPPVRPLEGHLVIDLATLRREAEHPCLLDGSPIPAPMGRELARTVHAWRRIVTDPVTGHLLDYGRRVYLPPPLVRFIHARDGQCTAPYCQRPATRCQMDHRTPFPTGRRTPRTAASSATATTPSRPTTT